MKLLEKYSIQKTDDIDREKFDLIWDMLYHDGYEKYREISQDEYWEEFCGNYCYIETSTDRSCFSTYTNSQRSYKPISSELLEIFLLRYSIQVDRINMGEKFSIKGEMFYFHRSFFIVAERIENSQLFTLLGIENKEKFTKHILGHCPNGEFPQCTNYEELKKLFLAMLDYAIEPFAYLEEGEDEEEKSEIQDSSELFPVGTIVQLSEIGLSEYKSQLDGEENKGSVVRIQEDSDFCYVVCWVGGHSNTYKKEDVELYTEDEKELEESLTSSNLVKGEIYVASENQQIFIFKKDFEGFLRIHSDSIGDHTFTYADGYKYRKATKFEEKWYKWCIRNNTFVNPEKLFEEACKKYPIGTSFRIVHKDDEVVKVSSHEKDAEWCVFNDSSLHINLQTTDSAECSACSVWTNKEGWAKVANPEVIVPDTQKETLRFKKDSYIVCLGGNSDAFLKNHCFKQRDDYDYLRPYMDCLGNTDNGWGEIRHGNKNWRYATQDEIFAYEQLGKPYDVTTLLQTSDEKVKVDPNVFPKGSYVVLLSTCDGDPIIWGDSIPINYVYQLRRDSNSRRFYMAKDTRGNVGNGWGVDEKTTYDSKLKLRAATTEEIALYKKHDGPVSIFDISKPLSGKEKMYPITPSEVFLPTPTVMEVVPKENYFPEVREIKL